ncbi:MAG: ATP-dependent helicase [Thermoplasmata archaeon]
MNEPNPEQKKLINCTEGIYMADAGPGTGKTFTISLRYASLLEQWGVKPQDIILITFTNNAAENIKERIINLSDHDKAELRDAPISTFHSFCSRLLKLYGHDAPRLIGINDRITQSTRIIENEVLERREFNTFLGDFMGRHPEYEDHYRITQDKANLLNLIRSLGAKGIFPTKEGWFRNSERYLDGDHPDFQHIFYEANRPRQGARSPNQSRLLSRLSNYKDKCFLPDAPSLEEIKGDGIQVPEKYAKVCFEEDRTDLKNFIHDLYFEYIKYALGRNYMNFSFMMMLAFALLCQDHALREKVSFDYMMIDEFQDTNEIQFKMALLLSRTGNICVVGDWKQSIFSFQYASVENIVAFKKRLEQFKKELNSDFTRVDYPIDIKNEIKLKKNYRSTQEIIDFSEQALLAEATKKEKLDKEEIKSRITKLKSVNNDGPGEIGAYAGEDEKKVILTKITEVVDNDDHLLADRRRIRYDDIVVLTRTRKFGLDLLKEAKRYGVPVAYEGGIELFRTRESLLLLAWMRILQNRRSKRGWAVVLDQGGYSMDEIQNIFQRERYPDDMYAFRNELNKKKSVGSLAKTVFDKYSINNALSDKIVEVVQHTYDNTYFNREDIINFIVDNIESQQNYDVDSTAESDVFNIQTIHSAKGLEYPVVILADMGSRKGGYAGAIEFTEPIGLRQNKIYSSKGYPYNYDNWKKYLLSRCLSGDYDEERRLLYVAMTRAKNYLYLTAEKDKKSEFFTNLEIKPKMLGSKISFSTQKVEARTELSVDIPETHAPVKYSGHSLIDDSIFQGDEIGLGKEYGTKVHAFADLYARGYHETPENVDEENIKSFLDSLDGKLVSEEPCLLPLEINGRKLLFQGIIDLLNIRKDSVWIVDYKTDRNKKAKQEYIKQVSIYHNVVKEVYPNKEVCSYLFYSWTNSLEEIEPLDEKELGELVWNHWRAD